MTDATAVQRFIDSWENLGAFAAAAGTTYGAAKQMRRRGSIPVQYWPALIASPFGQGNGLTSDRLLDLHSTQRSVAAPSEHEATAS